jgi:hypothetical protein
MAMDNENKSFLPFTEEELEYLNFTPEELEILEDASAFSQTAKMLPEDPDELIKKVEANFREGDDVTFEEVFEKLGSLCETDPDFITQLIATQELLTACRPDEDYEENE